MSFLVSLDFYYLMAY